MLPCSHSVSAYQGPWRDEVLALRREYVAPAVFTLYKEPVQIVRGYGQYFWDETGKRYLDAIAGQPVVPAEPAPLSNVETVMKILSGT